MLMNMCMAIVATRRVGLMRDVFGARFPRFCSYNSPPLCHLLGPPEIHKLNICPSRDPLMQHPPPREKDFSKYALRSPHPCLELFFYTNINMDMMKNHYFFLDRLEKSWNHDSLRTLKIIGYVNQHSRAMRCGREQFYTAALWLHTYHPKSLANNVSVLSKFGCLKYWLEILYRLVKGPRVRLLERQDYHFRRYTKSRAKDDKNKFCSREEKRIQMTKHAIEMYNTDPNYCLLHDSISDLYAELLKSDLESLDSGDYERISLASKWCPSINSSYDRSTLFCESVARRLFPYDSNPEYKGIEEAHYVYRIRDRLRREVLVPLRRALNLPEIYMTNKQWNLLPYDRVTFTAMKIYRKQFMKHDTERFRQYMKEDKKNRQKQKIFIGREMYPHDIFRLLDCGYDGEVAEVQWRRMVQAFSEKESFKNCIVAVQFSEEKLEDMPKVNQQLCLSFQLLCSELSESPWNGNILRQKQNGEEEKVTELLKIEGDDLQSKRKCLESLFTENSDFDVLSLLDKVLEVAVCCNTSREKMVRRIFVLGSIWHLVCLSFPEDISTEIEAKRKEFEDCGYVMPDIVLWEMDSPTCHDFTYVDFLHNDIMKLHGLSPRCIRQFFVKDGKIGATTMLDAHISGKNYMELKVFD